MKTTLTALAAIALLAATAVGCGDDLGAEGGDLDVLAGDGTVGSDGSGGSGGDAAGVDGTVIDAGCERAVGCVCSGAQDCDSGYCHLAGGVGRCDTTCATGGKPGCDDDNICTVDACAPSVQLSVAATCVYAAKKNGAPCDDGNACSTDDRCIAGGCSGDLLVCDDFNPCTTDSCDSGAGAGGDGAGDGTGDAAGGCVFTGKDGAPCDDGSACTKGDSCNAKTGACQSGAAIDCDDKNPCTDDACDSAAGCQHSHTTAACSDANVCTTKDVCKDGACIGGANFVCDDSNPCTDDACLPASGCTVTDNDGATCSDGSVCTVGDACKAGKCQAASDQLCDDANPCTADSCDHSKGCQYKNTDGAACDDGTNCTVGDTCLGGACKAGKPLVCDDGNPCTTDSCDATGAKTGGKGGCVVAMADGLLCVPATHACDTGGVCSAGNCKTVKATSCNDGNPCTTDTCTSLVQPGGAGKTGACVYTAVADGSACNDGNACFVKENCQKGACVGAPTDCDDASPCTVDSCVPAKGCIHTAKAGAGKKLPCDDGNLCTVGDFCNAVTCQPGAPQSCGDGNPCTDAACDPTSGCKPGAVLASCDDGNACTVGDSCKAGHCAPGTQLDCNDGNACTLDSCAAKSGCKSAEAKLSCSDGSVCTVGDLCKAGTCLAGKALICNDGNPCTTDYCDPTGANTGGKGGCAAKANSASCDDGDVCTSNDVCAASVCKPGSALSCDDKNGCTKDWCAATGANTGGKGGCQHSATASSCNDGNACTVGDTCKAGKCFPGANQVCDDGNHCTTDSCDPNSGCTQKPNQLGCDDGTVCTVADTCAKGSCQPGTKKLVCDDGNGCTDDLCDAKKGCTALLTNGICNDGNVCTLKDFCKAGKCVGGTAKSCDDVNKCTDDFCHATKGCIHIANGPSVFKPFIDDAKYNKGTWKFAGTTLKKGFTHVGSGYYQFADAKAGSTQTMTLQKKVDLQCTSAPRLYWQERYGRGSLYVEASINGKTWVVLAKHIGQRDYVWRTNSVDLAQYKGVAVYLRLRAVAGSTAHWWHLRALRLTEKEPPPPTVKWTALTTCSKWSTEGPAWKCDKTTDPFQLRYHGIKQVPDPNYYPNIIQLDLLLDAKGLKNPALVFEERSYHGNFYVDVRPAGGVWENAYTRNSGHDYVWRKRTIYLAKYAGKKAQIRLRSTQHSSYWGHVRSLRGVDKAQPVVPASVGVPSPLTDCKEWDFDGSSWQCDPVGAVSNLRYTGDSTISYNTNSFYHYANYAKRLDLTKSKLPTLRFDRRYYRGSVALQISEKKANWATVWQYVASADHVWRTETVDLAKFKGKKWYLRWRLKPGAPTYWGQFRKLRLVEKPKALPVAAYPFPISCSSFNFEGNSWKCDDAKVDWFLRLDTDATVPSTAGYDQSAMIAKWLDLSKAKAPGIAFEWRREYSWLRVDVSQNGSTWKEVFAFQGGRDYVWRKAHVDLAAFKGTKVLLRLRGRPGNPTYWGDLRKLRFLDVKPIQTVPFANASFSCAKWDIEGGGWQCADANKPYQLRYQGVSTQPNPNGYPHHVRSTFLIDLAKTTKPTLYFDHRRYYGTFYISVDGPQDSPKQVWAETGSSDTVWKRRRVDLSDYAGRKIRVSFDVRPGHSTYWGEVRNITFKEREPVKKVAIGSALKVANWTAEGGWAWHPKTARWHLSGAYYGAWQGVLAGKAIDLGGAKDPVLEFRESVQACSRAVRISEDGYHWSNAALDSATTDPVVHRKVISLKKWQGKVIFIKFDGYPTKISSWWQVFDIRVRQRPKIVKVAPNTALSTKQWAAEGLWKRSPNGHWALNHGVTGSTNSDTLLNYWQHVSSLVAFDISALKTPAITFEQRFNRTTGAVDISADGLTWEQVWYRPANSSWPYFFDRVRIPIGKFKNLGAVFIRFRGHPANNPTYWWNVGKISVGELPVVQAAGNGHVVTTKQWYISGDWRYDKANAWLQVHDKSTGRYHHATIERLYAVANNKAPKLVLEESWQAGRRIVQVSLDGVSWVDASNLYNKGGGSKFTTTTIDLSPLLGGTVGAKVHIRFRWHAVYANDWWRVRKVTFK